MRRSIYILIGVVLIAFGIGIYSLIYYDNFRLSNIFNYSGGWNIHTNDSNVSIGNGGIEVVDGRSRVKIGLSGIEVVDGDDRVSIGLDGIKVNDGKSKVNIGGIGNIFGITHRNLETFSINEEKLESIENIDSIKITSTFVDVKVITEDRDNLRIHYHGNMESNVRPTLEVDKMGKELQIKLTTNKNSYSVINSDVILEVIVPENYNEDLSINTSSGDIYGLDITGKYLSITSSSGDISFNQATGENITITTSSGKINTKDILGNLNLTSSSGDIVASLDKKTKDVNISTSSGDIDVFLGDEANFSVSGTTSSGDVSSSSSIRIYKERTGRFDFTVGNGENNMKVTTSSGDISFR